MHKTSDINFDENEEKVTKNGICIPIRYIIAGLVTAASIVTYITRHNLAVIIVDMANFNKSDSNINGSDLCPADDDYYDSASNKTDKTSSGEFDWNEKTQGIILGAFFWGYIFFQILGGRLSEIFGAKWLLGGGILLSIIINVLSPVLAKFNYYAFIASRVLLGISQSVIYPSCYALFAKWSPDHERSTLLSLPNVGANIGSVASSALSGYLSKNGFAGGWPSAFYVSGMISFSWLIVWVLFAKSSPEEHPFISSKELKYIKTNIVVSKNSASKKSVPWKKIFTSKPVLSATLAKFVVNWTNMVVLLKLPAYLNSVLRYPIDKNGFITSLVNFTITISLLVGGFVADKMIQKKIINKTLLRKIFESIATIGTGICLAIVPLVGCNKGLVIGLIVLSMVCFGMQAGGDLPIMADMTNEYCATVFALANSVAMICGFLTPYVIGVIVEADDHIRRQWGYVFYLSALINVIGGIVFIIFGSAEPQDWNNKKSKSNDNDVHVVPDVSEL